MEGDETPPGEDLVGLGAVRLPETVQRRTLPCWNELGVQLPGARIR